MELKFDVNDAKNNLNILKIFNRHQRSLRGHYKVTKVKFQTTSNEKVAVSTCSIWINN